MYASLNSVDEGKAFSRKAMIRLSHVKLGRIMEGEGFPEGQDL